MVKLTASGCFQGHDRLLSMAPIVIEGPLSAPAAFEGVPDLLIATMDSWRL
jgi:hypothetical protein